MTITSIAIQDTYKKAKALYDRKKFAESNKVLESIDEQVRLLGDKKLIGKFLALAGDNNFNLGNYQQCLQQFQEAEKVFKELKLMQELAEAENNLSAVYRRLGLVALSLFKNLEALTYSFQTNEEFVMNSSLMNAAVSLFDTGFTDKAFRALDTAMLVCDKHGGDEKYEEMRIVILNNKATFCIALRRFDETLPLLEQARALAAQYSVENRLMYIDSNMSMCLIKLNRVEEGFRLLESVIKRRGNVYDDHYVADIVKMGLIYKEHFRDEGRFLAYFDRGLKLAETKNLPARQIFINRILKDYYNSTGNHQQEQLFEKKLKALEEQDTINKQTGGIEKLFDTNVLAIENMLREKERKPEFLDQFDYLIGTYTYTHFGITRHVLLRDIAFCEIRGNYLYIHTLIKTPSGQMVLEESHKLRKTMKEFIDEIHTSMACFARIHNSFIVNLYWLDKDSVKGYDSLLIGGTELKISYTYRSTFKEKLNAFLEQPFGVE